MKKHTWPMVCAVLTVMLVGVLGSMRPVYATDLASLGIAAGAAKAFQIPTLLSGSSESTKGSQSTTEVVEGEIQMNISATSGSDDQGIVITTQKADDNGTAAGMNGQLNKTGEIGGIQYDSLVMANVQEAVNIRETPSEDARIVGKFYTECGGTILDKENGWTMVRTGEVTGWISNDYLLFGDAAVELAEKVVEKTATCTTDCLRVRTEANPDATVITLLATGETMNAVETEGDWVKVEFADGDEGYVSAEYVDITYELGKGETVEAIAAREAAEKEELERLKAEAKKSESSSSQNTASAEASSPERTTETTVTNNGGVIPTINGEIDDVRLLAALIQCEGGNQPFEGQVSVGTVVVNRLKSGRYGTSIYSVIFAKGQFGPAGTGAVAKAYADGPKATCVLAAKEALNGTSYIGFATHFRNVRSGYSGIVIGDHVFW